MFYSPATVVISKHLRVCLRITQPHLHATGHDIHHISTEYDSMRGIRFRRSVIGISKHDIPFTEVRHIGIHFKIRLLTELKTEFSYVAVIIFLQMLKYQSVIDIASLLLLRQGVKPSRSKT